MSTAQNSTSIQVTEIVGPLKLGVANYILIAVSSLLGLVIVAGIALLLYMECKRSRENKEIKFRQKLRVRRKGISGRSTSVKRHDSIESTECTSYIQLSETPTSGRGSIEGTPTSLQYTSYLTGHIAL